jgi:hypothetical protein
MSFEIKPATRTGVKPLVGFYGKSGSGKTFSALMFARGIAGPKGRLVLVDTENRRGSIFADLIPGGYQTLELDAPFTPMRYEEAIVEAEKVADVVIVDSMSHEWSGEGGVLDWADAELEKMGGGDNNKMRSWIKPKMAHKMMIQRLLRTKCALICCLRGEEKTHITKPVDGQKGKVITDEFSTPLFDPRFIFEMLLNFETVAHNGVGGFVIPRKITHPEIARLLPGDNEQITVQHGKALADWCVGTSKPSSHAEDKSTTATEVTRKWMVDELEKANLTQKALQFAIDKAYILPDETLNAWPLRHVPTSKAALGALKTAIVQHQ